MIALAGECRSIDERHYLRLVRDLLDEFAALGLLAGIDTAMVARLFLGVLIEGSQILGAPEANRATRANLRVALRRMLQGLLAPDH
ncbi:MAG: hypothetical protein H0V17_09580 [Deltaproteobacteria bacterium]|nr:hypothetical protein [Deltaproteobacteria bacterium]